MTTLGIAFKEWAVICKALAEGRQAIILRKGGIAEAGGEFRVEHGRFWLFPTYVHQQESGVVGEYRPLLERALAERPPAGTVRLTHYVEVATVWRVEAPEAAQALAGLHGWSAATVEARFRYREPGLFVLAVRAHRATPVELAETPYHAGCKSWVELGCDLPAEGAPVLSQEAFAGVLERLQTQLARCQPAPSCPKANSPG